jgi:anaerobic selenocysteine-containing dehydrogenase
MMNKKAPRIIVLDSRRTETAAGATDQFPLHPKSDLWLLYSIAHVLIAGNRIARDFIDGHTAGFDGLAPSLAHFSPERAALECGIPATEIRRLARLIASPAPLHPLVFPRSRVPAAQKTLRRPALRHHRHPRPRPPRLRRRHPVALPGTPGRTEKSEGRSPNTERGHAACPFVIRTSSFGFQRPGGRVERRLFADGVFYTPTGRAVFHFDAPRPMPEPPCPDCPFVLNTGRGSSAQWRNGTRTDKSDGLRKLAPRPAVAEIHPADAARLGIKNADTVIIRSRRGEARATTVVSAVGRPGVIFMPMHFEVVNRLTFPAFDSLSRQPSYKVCAVSLNPGLPAQRQN